MVNPTLTPAWKLNDDFYDEEVMSSQERKARERIIREALEHDCDPEAALEYYGYSVRRNEDEE